jgi:AraC-like DNA-binding protein
MTTKQVVWSSQVRQGTDEDLQPEEQFLYLPKFGRFHNQALLPLLQEMLSLRSGLTMERAFDLQLLLGKLLSSLQSELRTPKRVSRSIQIAEQVKQYLIKQFDQPYQAERMAEVLHFDGDYAARCLKKHTGMSPIQYHAYVRMEEARKLLIQTDLPVQEVAKRVGYDDYNYFIRMFRKTVGVPPREYRYGRGDTN